MNQPEIGLYSPGVVLTVGSHHAKVLKYLTSGGFAQVYTAEIQPADSFAQSNIACLKRVIVPDKPSLNSLRAEVDAMKLLKNNKHVVSYIDSHAAKSSFQNGSYEVFMLMEYCAGGGLIDFMNTRLQNRLQEFEVLSIMSQVTQGIAAMHALVPPLIHRDIKIENVLISHNGEYKVCDFGSVCGTIRPPKNPQEFAYVQHDVLKNTTAQYRAPEMIDLYRGHSIDEKSDIWALGVFLYKLCYYTTPFEKGGELAILHSRFQFPAQPLYSDRLKNLIRMMLLVDPGQRPNVCQALEEVSRMQGVECPIKNFYLLRAMEQQSTHKQLHYSRTQPIIHVPIVSQPMLDQSMGGQKYESRVPIHLSASTSHLVASKSVPQLSNRPNSTGSSATGMALRVDTPIRSTSRGESSTVAVPNRRRLSVGATDSFSNGRGNVSKIVSSNVTSFDKPVYVDSVTQTTGSESDTVKSTHSIGSLTKKLTPGKSGQRPTKSVSPNPSYMLKNEQKHTLSPNRPLSQNGDSVSVDSGYGPPRGNTPYLRSQSPTGNRESKESIQKRVHDLLNSSDDLPVPKIGHDQAKEGVRHGGDKEKDHKAKATPNKPKEKPRPAPKPAHLRPNPPPKPAALMGKRLGPKNEDNSIIDGKAGSFRKKVPGVL